MKKIITSILAFLMCILVFAGCNNKDNTLSRSTEMQSFEKNGYINQLNDKSNTQGDLTLRVLSIASDGLTTYVQIAYDGKLPQVNIDDYSANENTDTTLTESPSQAMFDEDTAFLEKNNGGAVPSYTSFATKNIKEIKLSVDTGDVWNFSHQFMLGSTGDPFPVVRPILNDKTLAQNEAILIFYGTEISDMVDFSLELEVRGIDEKFVINDMQCKIAPVKTRVFQTDSLIYEAPLANMKLISMKSSLLETIVTFEWDLSPDFSHTSKFFSEQQIVFDWGDASNGTFMFYPTIPSLSENKNNVLIRSHSIKGSIPVDKKINVYAFDTLSQSKTADMFVIPAE